MKEVNHMTTGQRISQLRKEHHLSQEELGSKLGVSRQSIYKWESDASLPEIEKLIALSRLFSVSVGWLLGVEEQPQAGHEQETSPELTPQQLKMVEDITTRYLNTDVPHPKRKMALMITGGVILAAAILLAVRYHSQMQDMQQQYFNLQNNISNMQNNVNDSIAGISQRVEEILKSQNSLTTDYKADYVSTDIKANTVTFRVSAVPKTYSEGMRAVFCATQGSSKETTETEGTLSSSNLEFYADLVCPLSDDISISVSFITDDKKENQYMLQFTNLLSETIPELSLKGHNFVWTPCKKGTLSLSRKYILADPDQASAPATHEGVTTQIQSIQVGIFKNKQLVSWAKKVPTPPNYIGFKEDFYALPADLEIPFEKDDSLAVAAVITDEYGREFFFVADTLALNENNELTWAQNSEYGYVSAQGWTF